MKAAFELAGEPRAQLGRTDSRRLRKAGKVPAIMYGGGEAPEALVLDHNALTQPDEPRGVLHEHPHAEDRLEGAAGRRQGRRAPSGPAADHAPRLPARPRGRRNHDLASASTSPARPKPKGVKDQGGVVDHLLTDVEVRCLPRYLPEYLELDVTALELNQIYHLSDIKAARGRDARRARRRPRPSGRRRQPAARRGNRHPGRRPRRRPAKCPHWRRPSPASEGEAAAAMPRPSQGQGGRRRAAAKPKARRRL